MADSYRIGYLVLEPGIHLHFEVVAGNHQRSAVPRIHLASDLADSLRHLGACGCIPEDPSAVVDDRSHHSHAQQGWVHPWATDLVDSLT